MSKVVDWVDGWEVRSREDHGYGVYDDHGLVAGPFGTEAAAIQAALLLPKHHRPNRLKDVTPRLVGHQGLISAASGTAVKKSSCACANSLTPLAPP